MKNKILFLILFSTQTIIAQAQTNPSNAESEINAQVGITRSFLGQFNEELDRSRGNLGFNVSDYRTWSGQFRKDVAQVMATFESELNQQVLADLRTYMNQYNSTIQSTALGETQRQMLLNRLKETRPQVEADLSSRYQQLINRLYRSITPELFSGSEPVVRYGAGSDFKNDCDFYYQIAIPSASLAENFCAKLVGSRKKKMLELNGTLMPDLWSNLGRFTREYPARETLRVFFTTPIVPNYFFSIGGVGNCLGYDEALAVAKLKALLPTSEALKKKYFDSAIYPIIAKGCDSQACLAFHAADLKNFIELIRKNIDRTMTFKLSDDNGYRSSVVTLSRRDDPAIPFAIEAISRVDYPAAAAALPFDTK